MSVVVEGYCVVVERRTVEKKYPGGLAQFSEDSPNSVYCYDDYLTCNGFMSDKDALQFIDGLQKRGLVNEEIALVDQNVGLLAPRDWMECAKHKDGWAICWLKGTDRTTIAAPAGWTPEAARKRQQTMSFLPISEFEKQFEFLRREESVDVYRHRKTGEIRYVGRTTPPSKS